MNNPSDRLEVSGPDVVVVHDDKPDVTVTRDSMSVDTQRSKRGRMTLVAGLLALAVAAALAVVFLGGDDTVSTEPRAQTQPKAPVAEPAQPLITIEPPATVVAGKPATFTVNYELSAGRFTGSIEEWGDGIGGGSTKQESCESTAQTSGPTEGRYSVTHTWAQPGTYDVVLGVNAYSCVGVQSREFKASRTLPVTVVAP